MEDKALPFDDRQVAASTQLRKLIRLSIVLRGQEFLVHGDALEITAGGA
jgi:hypothetical protein